MLSLKQFDCVPYRFYEKNFQSLFQYSDFGYLEIALSTPPHQRCANGLLPLLLRFFT